MVNSTGQLGVDPFQTQNLGLSRPDQGFPLVPVTSANRDPTVNDVHYATSCEWTNTVTQDMWKLYGFISGQANWKKLAAGSVPGGTMVSVSDTASTKVFPDATGNVQLVGTAGQINIVSTPASNLLTFSLAGGGTAVDQIAVDAATVPGTNPVIANGSGQITVRGTVVANHSIPIQTDSLAANTINIETQYGTTASAVDGTKTGFSAFNSAQFQDGGSGFISLKGSTTAAPILGFTPDTGTSPVVADASGLVKIQGSTPATSNTRGIQVTGALNELDIAMFSPYTLGDFAFQSTAGGATRTLTIENTVDAASSQATNLVKVAGTTSGDVWTQYSIGSTNSYGLGIDNSDSDKLKITWAASGSINPSSGSEYVALETTGKLTFQSTNSADSIISQYVGGSLNSTYRAFRGRNLSAGTSAAVSITMDNDVGSSECGMRMASSTNTNSLGEFPPSQLYIFNNNVGSGIQISTQASGSAVELRTPVNGSATSSDRAFSVISITGDTVQSIRCNSRMDTTAGGGQAAKILNAANYELARDTSSIRYKTNIVPLSNGLNQVMALKPCLYNSKCSSDDPHVQFMGLIAEEVAEVVPEVICRNKDGSPESINYERLVPVLVKAIQELVDVLVKTGVNLPHV